MSETGFKGEGNLEVERALFVDALREFDAPKGDDTVVGPARNSPAVPTKVGAADVKEELDCSTGVEEEDGDND
ncbi:MAG TPA: hypothetical protein VFF30_10925 [Nitrososphaerales archaeon]|nr:hypothetical protein [Nitrososphaerales archaeon]